MNKPTLAALSALALASTTALAATFPEVEPNNTRATATVVPSFDVGDQLTGTSTGNNATGTGTANWDTFLLNFPASAAPGIYRNRITVSATGHQSRFVGIPQTADPIQPGSVGPGTPNPAGSDQNIGNRLSTSVVAYNQFYTFGPATSAFYRVAGSTTSTSPYTATYTSRDLVTPTNLGTFHKRSGDVVFTNIFAGNDQNTAIVLYDENYNLVAQNDDIRDAAAAGGFPLPPGADQRNSYLPINLPNGTYTLGISIGLTATDRPADFLEGSATNSLLTDDNILVNGSLDSVLRDATDGFDNIPFSIILDDQTIPIVTSKDAPFDISFFTFTLIPEPTTLGLLAGAGLLALRRRK